MAGMKVELMAVQKAVMLESQSADSMASKMVEMMVEMMVDMSAE